MHLLVVEDDPVLQKLLYKGLTAEGHVVDLVHTGEDALERTGDGTHDAMVLDLTLPDIDGLEVTRRLRAAGTAIPILMLTGRDQLSDRLSGFAAGADDYLVKPFALRELQARLLAVTRRPGQKPENDRQAMAELRDAIEQDQLILHYQPKINIRTGQLESVEALVRWQHPERGLVPPAEFIPLAETTGLIRPLTIRVLNQALYQCRLWYQAGLTIPAAVNLSAQSLQKADLPDTVAALVRRWAVSSSWLTLEITESAIMTDTQAAVQILTRLHDMGVSISIDDFGTGYSSLGYLKRLPVNEIKIDRIFVAEMTANEDDSFIARAVVELGHHLRLHVVAEGVENQPTLEMLAAIDCDAAQGYYLSHPLPAGEMTSWLRDQPSRSA